MKLSPALEKAVMRFDDMSARERVLICAAVLAVMLVLWDTLCMQPLTAKQQALTAEIQSIEQTMAATADALEAANAADATNVVTAQLQSAESALTAVNKELISVSAGLVPPERMAEVIHDVLLRRQAVSLISLRNLPAISLVAVETAPIKTEALKDSSTAEVEKSAGPYVHPVELLIEGRYLDVLDYLRALEALPWRFYWRTLQLETTEYPINRVRIEVSTLSLDQTWLGV